MRARNFGLLAIRKMGTRLALLLFLVAVSVLPFFSRDHAKYETIEATAMGTGTQLGASGGVSLEIYDYSSPEDRQVLMQAFEKGQNQGLVNALSRMRAVGHCSITGTLGYDVAYIRMIPTPTGRKIRFVTNRQLRFGEVYWDTQSTAYNLTAGEFDLNDQDHSKSSGVLYPLAQLVIDKEGQLQFELNQNPWKLVDVLDWKGTPGVN
jgi:hypothetical protein